MAYERLHWVESETPLSADNMNNIEDGIEELQSQKVDKVSGKGLSDQNYTSDEKTKLSGIEAGAEVNQNAFSEILVNGSLISADAKTDHFQVIASNGIEVASLGDSLMINGKTVTTSANGVMSASDKSKLNGIEAGANNYSLTKTTTTKKSSSNYVVSAGGRGSISFSLSGADKGSLTSVLLKDTEGNRVNLCIIGWEATSSSVTIFVYNPTSHSIQVDGTKSQIVVTTYN